MAILVTNWPTLTTVFDSELYDDHNNFKWTYTWHCFPLNLNSKMAILFNKGQTIAIVYVKFEL